MPVKIPAGLVPMSVQPEKLVLKYIWKNIGPRIAQTENEEEK